MGIIRCLKAICAFILISLANFSSLYNKGIITLKYNLQISVPNTTWIKPSRRNSTEICDLLLDAATKTFKLKKTKKIH